MAPALVRWVVQVTWTPIPGTYSPVTKPLWFLMPATATQAQLHNMALVQVTLCDVQNPSTLSAATLDTDLNDYDRNDVVI